MKYYFEDIVRVYLREIGRYPLLNSEQEIDLGRKIQKSIALNSTKISLEKQLGREPTLDEWAVAVSCSSQELLNALASGKKAKSRMIQTNLRLVVTIAKKYQHRGVEFMDLIQEGNIGLSQAVEKFDPERGFRFSTYAFWWIRQAITRAIAQKKHSIRLPCHLTEKLNKVKKARRELSQEQGKIVTISEIAKYLEEKPENVRLWLLANSKITSLNTLVGEERETEIMEFIKDERQSPDNYLLEIERAEQIEDLLKDLAPMQQEVIKQRFGLGKESPKSLAKIGKSFGISRERVRQIESHALKKLKGNTSAIKAIR
ncbi:RNA polymerase sigma factor, RpoD/SigA family [Pleurocapsales cyanobacterium LEGE 10410]|nr:RNA polymerase sigma factor, RpoD/SigA family [Pleurocapsales cyanobacterium LEGE 10410]